MYISVVGLRIHIKCPYLSNGSITIFFFMMNLHKKHIREHSVSFLLSITQSCSAGNAPMFLGGTVQYIVSTVLLRINIQSIILLLTEIPQSGRILSLLLQNVNFEIIFHGVKEAHSFEKAASLTA